MKYAKILGLLALAATALMAFAATASATTLTSPTGTTYTSTVAATAGATSLEGAFVTVTCNKSILEGKIESHGKGVTGGGKISTLDFTECNFPTKVAANGAEEYHAIRKDIQPHTTCLETDGDTCLGTLTSSGTITTVETSLGSCTFTTSSTSIGTVTTTAKTGGKAVIDIAATIPRTGGSFLCGSSATWTGSYTINTPSTLWFDE
jgi:hypothetical protein